MAPEALVSHVGDYPRKRSIASVAFEHGELTLQQPDGPRKLQPMSDGSFLPDLQTEGGAPEAIAGERYRFADVGPYHFLFVQSQEDGDYQVGYRVATPSLNDEWCARVSGTYTYPLVVDGPNVRSRAGLVPRRLVRWCALAARRHDLFEPHFSARLGRKMISTNVL